MSKNSNATNATTNEAITNRSVESVKNNLKLDPAVAKESYGKISVIIKAANKTPAEKLTEIKELRDNTEDSILRVFADSAMNVMKLEESVELAAEDKTKALDSLITNFDFLGTDTANKDDNLNKTVAAIHSTASSAKEPVSKAINDGLQDGFFKDTAQATQNSQTATTNESDKEKEAIREANKKAWDIAVSISSKTVPAMVAITIALTVAPPFGTAIALGFIAYCVSKDTGEKQNSGDPAVDKYANAWEEYMEKAKQQSTAQQQAAPGQQTTAAQSTKANTVTNAAAPTATGTTTNPVTNQAAPPTVTPTPSTTSANQPAQITNGVNATEVEEVAVANASLNNQNPNPIKPTTDPIVTTPIGTGGTSTTTGANASEVELTKKNSAAQAAAKGVAETLAANGVSVTTDTDNDAKNHETRAPNIPTPEKTAGLTKS